MHGLEQGLDFRMAKSKSLISKSELKSQVRDRQNWTHLLVPARK